MSARPGAAQRSHKPARVRPHLGWQEHAICVDYDPEMFFDPAREREAKSVCAGCPVQAACRDFGRSQAAGVWGGKVRNSQRTRGVSEFLMQPHGTEAGYKRHIRAGETPCAMCRAGSSAQKAARS